jgi:hypothetical protein
LENLSLDAIAALSCSRDQGILKGAPDVPDVFLQVRSVDTAAHIMSEAEAKTCSLSKHGSFAKSDIRDNPDTRPKFAKRSL